MTIKILFLASNPQDTPPLNLAREVRSIQGKLRLSEFRDDFKLEQEWAVRVSDLQEILLRHQPHIVHFSGHGNTRGEIILEDAQGNSFTLPPELLKKLFQVLKDNISCVILNACFSKVQADAIAEAVNCVIGMSDQISDEAAITFAANFYQALGFGRSIQTAFDLACLEIAFEKLGEENTPQLLTQPEVQPDRLYLVRESVKTQSGKKLFDISSDPDRLDTLYGSSAKKKGE